MYFFFNFSILYILYIYIIYFILFFYCYIFTDSSLKIFNSSFGQICIVQLRAQLCARLFITRDSSGILNLERECADSE